nr:M56 family metallopeptidase [candidate division Zixibacteria bacterium]
MYMLEYLPFFLRDGSAVLQWPLLLIIKSALIAAIGLAVVGLMNRAAPATRNLVSRTALAAIVLLPLLSLVTPAFNLPLTDSFPASWRAMVASAAMPDTAGTDTTGRPVFAGLPVIMWLFPVWVGGVMVVLGRFGYGIIAARRIIRQSCRVMDEEIIRTASSLAQSYGLDRPANLAVSTKVQAPFVFGLFNPTVILPSKPGGFQAGELRMILMHELAHIRRHDLIWAYIGSLVLAVNWFNPLVWLLRRRMIIESDKTCDDFVINGGADPGDFAQSLVALARRMGNYRPVLSCGADMANKSQLEERIMSILRKGKRTTATGRLPVMLLAVPAMVLMIGLAGVRIWADDDPAKGAVVKEKVKAGMVDSTKDKWPSPDEFVALTKAPEQIKCVPPEYPIEAQKAGIEGVVWVQVLVDEAGTVQKVMIKKSSGEKMLDEAALKSAYTCNYIPGEQDGKPITVWVAYNITFSLDGKGDQPEKNRKVIKKEG